jgi:DNA-binding MarR family transcriptional regulator
MIYNNVTNIVTIDLENQENGKRSISNLLTESKSADILKSLYDRPSNVRGLFKEVGGSLSTIVQRIRSLSKAGLIIQVKTQKRGKYFDLTEKGRGVVTTLKWFESGEASSGKLVLDEGKKWIIALLYTLGEIKGSTRLEKLLFLLKEQFKIIGDSFYDFTPYLFGPYSPKVLEDAKVLRGNGVLDITLDVFESQTCLSELSDAVFIRKNYKLTEKGKELAKKIIPALMKKNKVKEALFELRAFNSMPLSNLLNTIYQHFPQFTPPDDLP